MADEDPVSLPVSSLRSRFEQIGAKSNTDPRPIHQLKPPSRPNSLVQAWSSPEPSNVNGRLTSVQSQALAAALKRPPPPPPPARPITTASRSPSPAPPTSTVPPSLPARSSFIVSPPLPSRSNAELNAMARNTIIHHELDTSSSSGSTGSGIGSRSSGEGSGITEPCTCHEESASQTCHCHQEDDHLIELYDDDPGSTGAPLGAGIRRGSLPIATIRKETLAAQQVLEPTTMVRAATHHIQQPPSGSAPPPPARPKPAVPPRPSKSTSSSQLADPISSQGRLGTGTSSPSPANRPITPSVPPLPSRDKKAPLPSDEDIAVPPPPPPRLPSRRVPQPETSISPSLHAPPPPAHPSTTLGHSYQYTQSQPHQHKLKSAITKVKNALPLHHSSKDKTLPPVIIRASNVTHMSISSNEEIQQDDTEEFGQILASPRPLPPPVRSLVVGDRLPPPRRNTPTPSTGADYDDVSSSSDSEETNNTGSNPPGGVSPYPTHPRRTLDELPDSSRSSRKPPFITPVFSSSSPLPPIHCPAPSGVSAIAGDMVCVASTSLRIYDLSSVISNNHRHSAEAPAPPPTFIIDLKDLGLEWRVEKPRITAIAFRPSHRRNSGPVEKDEGRYLWCGTKDGHLFELDVFNGHVIAVKNAAHGSAIIHILRYGDSMLTIEEGGKALIFGTGPLKAGDSDADSVEVPVSAGISYLLESTPKVVRIADKQGFAKIMYGKLWTANGPGSGGTNVNGFSAHDMGAGGLGGGGSAGARGPTIRVYDIYGAQVPSPKSSLDNATSSSSPSTGSSTPTSSSGFLPQSRFVSLLQTESGVGAVTSAAILMNKPGLVYLGHEGGYVSVWDSSTPTSPACLQTMKVATSDIMCMEGVRNRIWAGSRKGLISVYDVESRPWTVTNVWKHASGAHGTNNGNGLELPILKLALDPLAIEQTGRLTVISFGRDEHLRFWDGLLGSNWIDGELLQREASFSTFRNINMLVCTWNVNAVKPAVLGNPQTGDAQLNEANICFLNSCLKSVDRPDILVFGFQELIDLESRKLTAKTMLLGSQKNKKNADGTISVKVSTSYKLWFEALKHAVQVAMPPEHPYTVIHTENLVGLFTCIFVRKEERATLRDISITTVKRGMGGHYGNKGAIVARFVIDDSSLCFVNCHLAAGQSQKQARNHDLAAIFEEKSVFPESSEVADSLVAYAGGGDGTMLLDHEFVFLNGDLNYRIDQRRESVLANVREGELEYLLSHDQLLKEMKNNPGFRLRSFMEGPITFPPTYKYDPKTNTYDTSEKRRVPAWCDRILYRCRDSERVQILHYQRYEANVSDHRPVSAGFKVRVKSVRPLERMGVRAQLEDEWRGVQKKYLGEAKTFYSNQGWI